MSAAEAGNTRQFLIFLDQGFGLAIYFVNGNFNLDLPPGAAASFSGAHIYLSSGNRTNCPFLGQEEESNTIGCNSECKD